MTGADALARVLASGRTVETIAALERTRDRHDEIVQRIEALDRSLPDDASVSEDEIREVVLTLLDVGIRALTDGRAPAPDDDQLVALLLQQRAGQGVSPSSFLMAVQLGTNAFFVVFDEEARRADIPADEVLGLHAAVRELTNALVATLSDAYRQRDARERRTLERRQAGFVRSLAFGRPDPRKLDRAARSLGLDPSAGFYAISVPVDAGLPGARLRDLRRAVNDLIDGAGLVAIVGEQVVAITTVRPRSARSLAVVGIAGPRPLIRLSGAFDDARGAAETAAELGITGIVDDLRLGPLPLVVAAPRAAAALDHHHYGPLDAEGRIGQEIANTVACYLAQDHNVDAAAAELHVHRNTVHHRLRRFRELTQLDVRRTDDLVVAWWLLRRRELMRT